MLGKIRIKRRYRRSTEKVPFLSESVARISKLKIPLLLPQQPPTSLFVIPTGRTMCCFNPPFFRFPSDFTSILCRVFFFFSLYSLFCSASFSFYNYRTRNLHMRLCLKNKKMIGPIKILFFSLSSIFFCV